MKYIITIEEIISNDFEVEADNLEDALEVAENNYRDGKFVLEPGNLIYKQISGSSVDGRDCCEWYEF